MQLVDNWGRVLRHAWSVRLILLAAVLTGAEAVLPLFPDLFSLPPGLLAFVTFLIVVGAFLSRFVVQAKVSGGADEQA